MTLVNGGAPKNPRHFRNLDVYVRHDNQGQLIATTFPRPNFVAGMCT
jgi:hypothetical protein